MLRRSLRNIVQIVVADGNGYGIAVGKTLGLIQIVFILHAGGVAAVVDDLRFAVRRNAAELHRNIRKCVDILHFDQSGNRVGEVFALYP